MHCILSILYGSWLCLKHLCGCLVLPFVVEPIFLGFPPCFDAQWAGIGLHLAASVFTLFCHSLMCASAFHTVEYFANAISSCVILVSGHLNSSMCSSTSESVRACIRHLDSNANGSIMHSNWAIMILWHIWFIRSAGGSPFHFQMSSRFNTHIHSLISEASNPSNHEENTLTEWPDSYAQLKGYTRSATVMGICVVLVIGLLDPNHMVAARHSD